MSSATPVGAPARPSLAVLAVVLGAIGAGACATQGSPTAPASSSPSASAASALPSSTPAVTPPGPGPCQPTWLTARVTGWTGAAGSRIASVEMRNTVSSPCTVIARARPQLVDSRGNILIDGGPPGAAEAVLVNPGETLRTEVRTSNYCGPEPALPATIAFVNPGGLGRVVAAPAQVNGDESVPPCLGSAGSAGTIEMQPWQP